MGMVVHGCVKLTVEPKKKLEGMVKPKKKLEG